MDVTLNLHLPTGWHQLSQHQLRYVFFLIGAGYTGTEMKTYCLARWAGLEILAPHGEGYAIRYESHEYHITALQVAEVLASLNWLEEIPLSPVCLEKIQGKQAAVAPDLAGLTFENYLICDNLYTGYLHTNNTDLLEQMAHVLYAETRLQLDGTERIAIFYWFASAKRLFSSRFTYLFQPADGGTPADMQAFLQELMNTQIRALTKGDITKESQVLSMDVWRALTELNAQAHDVDELKKQTHK